ncbi:hypothetical protein GUITHDRAFT_99339 [Guillardia theta CCMP2712]|uniref:RRM domain-containing protein n=1 Tax=Guillardia theta (strain CCMP2712) TaxID=905079 RepID=L1K2T9_GUITC|nr:hypothetical protein GUITHDRAFT_99339 [Guillardia theta CCMP2712]EKX54683.1 hypothetical protein GUITHDRAFT_99339 [Guillardia theta CCMP2712]|eukprot:XP_005841663.1 hypothetical protein GUITHDRAFT_99339 [Guillardia theta CCMP2712]
MLPRQGPYTFQVGGFDPATNQGDLEEFLKNKSEVPFEIEAGSSFRRDSYTMKMNDFEAAKSILRLSGIRFRGQKLEITCNEASTGTQVGGPVLPDHLKQQIHQGLLPLFRAEAKMLLCENLAGRWQASEQTASLRVEWTNFKFVNTIMVVL